jgi:hypothetical protein
MLDTDGQRPEAIPGLRQYLTMVQVTVDFPASKPIIDRAVESLAVAGGVGHMHALVLAPLADTNELQMLRVIEQAHRASEGTMIVVHPHDLSDGSARDRRWSEFMDQALAVHADVRIALRLPPPAGMR